MTTLCRSEFLEGALGLAARGIPVIPLRPRSKIPLHANWPGLGMLDADSIGLEWEQNPCANVGVLGGPDALDGHGLIVVDIDMPDGPGTLEALEDKHRKLPCTATVTTPSGGAHHYYRGHAVSWNPGPGLEIRSAGRQCAAPPSVHPNGGRYTWSREMELVQAPLWLSACQQAPCSRAREVTRPGRPGLQDPVLEVPPPVYFEVLCGLVPDRQGFVPCPIHGEIEPSLKVYPTADRGWFCYGASHYSGGDVVTLAAELAGITTPVRGYEFMALLSIWG